MIGAGAGGSWSPFTHNQETDQDSGAQLLVSFMQPRAPACGIVLPALRRVFPLPLKLSENAVLDTGRTEVCLLCETKSSHVDNED